MVLFERVNKLAKERGISISRLAGELGLSSQSVYKWKTNMPSADKLQKAAEYFDVSTDYLLGLTDTPERIKGAKRNGDGFLRIDLSDVPEAERDSVVNQLEAFKRYVIDEALKEDKKRKNENTN